jgi:hypothetical protein
MKKNRFAQKIKNTLKQFQSKTVIDNFDEVELGLGSTSHDDILRVNNKQPKKSKPNKKQ